MKTIFEPAAHEELFQRLGQLTPDAERQWGKMSIGQMLAHCQQPLRVALGELPLKRSVVGLLFGRIAKKKLLAPEPWKPGLPTAPEFRIGDAREFEQERAALRAQPYREKCGLACLRRSGCLSATALQGCWRAIHLLPSN